MSSLAKSTASGDCKTGALPGGLVEDIMQHAREEPTFLQNIKASGADHMLQHSLGVCRIRCKATSTEAFVLCRDGADLASCVMGDMGAAMLQQVKGWMLACCRGRKQ